MADYFSTGTFNQNSGHSWHRKELFLFNADEYPSDKLVSSLFEKVGMDFTYHLAPYQIMAPDGSIIKSDKEAIIRSPSPVWDDQWREIRSNVSNTNVIDPMVIAEALNPLAEEYTVDGVMTLKDGGVVIVSMQMPDVLIADMEEERHKTYFAFAQDLTRPLSITIAETWIRAQCWNTWQMILGRKEGVVRIPHSARDVESIIQVMAKNRVAIVKRREREIAFLNNLFTSDTFGSRNKIDEKAVTKFVADLFPAPKKSWASKLMEQTEELKTALTAQQQEALSESAERANDVLRSRTNSTANTRAAVETRTKQMSEENDYGSVAYWLFQAATEVLNHGNEQFGVHVRGNQLQKYLALNHGTKASMLNSVRQKFEKVV